MALGRTLPGAFLFQDTKKTKPLLTVSDLKGYGNHYIRFMEYWSPQPRIYQVSLQEEIKRIKLPERENLSANLAGGKTTGTGLGWKLEWHPYEGDWQRGELRGSRTHAHQG